MTLTPETIASHCDALNHFCTHALAWAKFAKSLPPTSEIIAPHYDALHAIFAHMRSLGPNLQKSLPAGTTQASHVWKIGQRTHHSKTCLLPGLAQSFFFFNLLDSWLAPSFYVCCNVPCLYVRHYNKLQFSPRANKSSNFCNLYVKASFSRKIIFWLVLDLFWICPEHPSSKNCFRKDSPRPSGIPEAETFGQNRKFSAFGLRFWPPKVKAEYGRNSRKALDFLLFVHENIANVNYQW